MLTKTNGDGTFDLVDNDSDKGYYFIPWREIPYKCVLAVLRLADYEKTGLNPDTIEIVVRENKRLCEGILALNKRVDELQRIIEGVN